MKSKMFWLYLVFLVSGFAGLIYQSVWTQYLGLMLGHAAYAQTLVLGLFMGGMAVGAFLVTRKFFFNKDALVLYALAELIIGVFGVVFHALFTQVFDLTVISILPAIDSPALVKTVQWLIAGLLILPQCVLLGATFPLLSTAMIRLVKTEDSKVLGGLYFTNSIGAAIGALVSTFVLLSLVGMPGSVMTAGLLNILVALITWVLWKRMGDEPPEQLKQEAALLTKDSRGSANQWPIIFYTGALITGLTSFVYEIAWIRMLNQVLGASLHSFEIMLAAFISGLAFGGLFVNRSAKADGAPILYAGVAQCLMGFFALLSLVAFSNSFHWLSYLYKAIDLTNEGYMVFSLGKISISLLVMFPAAFFAGMTLPLFTTSLMRMGHGQKAIGRVYAMNTLGAILGVFGMVHVLIPLMGISYAILLGAVLDILLGAVILLKMRKHSQAKSSFSPVLVPVLSLVIGLLAFMMFGQVKPEVQVAGVFRSGSLNNEIKGELFLEDGKTATVTSYMQDGKAGVIKTNGKPDAALILDDSDKSTEDEPTMVMLGVAPILFHPAPKDVAVIGWGSGLSTHVLLGDKSIEHVETIEIEPQMVEAAKLFKVRNHRAYDDPRSQLIVDDARTYFAAAGKKYDVVVSEPSNPWVSGVASLFTQEFYQLISRHIKDDGVLIQWMHGYEFNDKLFSEIMLAMVNEYEFVELYEISTFDFLLAASHKPINMHGNHLFDYPALKSDLKRTNFKSLDDFKARRVATEKELKAYALLKGVNPHSDFFPTVSLEAPKAMFMKSDVRFLSMFTQSDIPLRGVLQGKYPSVSTLEDSRRSEVIHSRFIAEALSDVLLEKTTKEKLANLSSAAINNLAIWDVYQCEGDFLEEHVNECFDLINSIFRSSVVNFAETSFIELWRNPSWVGAGLQEEPKVKDFLALYQKVSEWDEVLVEQEANHIMKQSYFKELDLNNKNLVLNLKLLALFDQSKFSEVQAVSKKHGDILGEESISFDRDLIHALSESEIRQKMLK